MGKGASGAALASVSYRGSVEEPGQEVRNPGHVKSMMNLSLVMCKILKLPSPVINDKLIPISFFFFRRRAESVEEGRIIVYGWRQALKVRTRARNRKRTVEMAPNQVRGEMVLDGGRHFIPAGIFGLHTLSLLLSSLAAHDRATDGTRTHTGKEHQILYHYTLVHFTKHGYSTQA